MAENPKPGEHETYELAEPDAPPVAASRPTPDVVKPAKADQARTYDLEDVTDQAKPPLPSPPLASKTVADPRISPPPPSAPPAGDLSKSKIKTRVFTPEEAEPAYVSPEVAARKREDARVRAAELAAIEDARRRKRNLIVIVAVVVVAMIGIVVWKMIM